mgnify:CR=1 FL=1
MLKIIEANDKYLDQYKEAYIESLKQIELGNIKRHDMMFLNPNDNDIVQHFKDSRDQSKLPSYYVPSYDYFVVDDDKFIGVIHIRIRLTENLLRYGGHIGYAVNPKYWKFDDYQFEKMDEEDEVYKLLSNYEDVDFSKYFQY